jgi:hypothetical protein
MLELCAWQPDALLACTAALMGISVEKESKLPVAQHAGQQLVKLLKAGGATSDNKDLTRNVRAVLMSACEHLEARRLIEAHLTQEEMAAVLYRGALPSTPPDYRNKVCT